MVPESPFRAFVLLAATLCASALQPYGHGQAPVAPARTQIQSRPQIQMRAIAMVSVTCVANPVSVFTGGAVTVQALGRSLQGLPVRYAFTTDAGQLTTNGPVTRLGTAGLGARTVHVTCTAMDSAGRSASQVAEVRVLGVPHTEEMRIPAQGAHPPTQTIHPPTPGPPAPIIVPPPPPPAPKPEPKPVQGETAEPSKQGQQQQQQREPDTTAVEPKPAPTTPTATDQEKTAPAPVTTPGPGQDTPVPTQPAVPDEYKQSKEVADWVSHLKQGKIEYQVPGRMLMQQASTVTVVIHGFQDVKSTTLPQATGGDSLKQSERMKVALLADGNAFTIAPQDSDAIKFIPINGTAMWTWKVTPNSSGERQPLEIVVWLIYPNVDKTEQQVQDYKTTVEVNVPSVWSTIADNYQHDPLKFFSYMIPGGAGFTFLAGLVVWWWRRKHKDEKD